MGLPFFTIGHSNRTLDAFVDLLREAGVGFLADIRKLPGSRAFPQFDAEPLQARLDEVQIGYQHIASLGGRRGKQPDAPQGLNGLWTNASFRNYADYALTPPFQAGLQDLIAEGRRRRTAIMCAEAVWWRCHRRIVSDYLLARGETVFHILGEGQVQPARLTPGGMPQSDGRIFYPRPPGDDPSSRP